MTAQSPTANLAGKAMVKRTSAAKKVSFNYERPPRTSAGNAQGMNVVKVVMRERYSEVRWFSYTAS